MTTGLSYDFYAPFMQAVIIEPNGTRWPLWTRLPQTDSQRAAAGLGNLQSLPFLTELTVKLDLSGVAVITAVLSPPIEEGRLLLNSSVIEWGASHLQVQFGYIGSGGSAVLSPMYSGLMLQPEIQFASPDISITLKAQGEGGFDATRTHSHKTLNNVTRLAALQSLAAGPDLQRPLKINVEEVEQNTASDAFRKLHTEVNVAGGGHTNWYLMQIIARQCLCWIVQIGDTLYLRPWDKLLVGEPRATFYFYDYPGGRFSPTESTYPILSASSPLTSLYFTGVSKGLMQSGVGSKSGDVINQLFTDADLKPTRSGDGAIEPTPKAVPTELDPSEISLLGTGPRNGPAVRAEDERLRRNAAAKAAAIAEEQAFEAALKKALSSPAQKAQDKKSKKLLKTLNAKTPVQAEGTSPNPTTGDGAARHSEAPDSKHAFDKAKSEFAEFSKSVGIKLEIETLGIPNLFPGDPIAVRGLGARHDRNHYAVLDVTHSLGGDGFKSTLNAISNSQPIEDSRLAILAAHASGGVAETTKPNNDPLTVAGQKRLPIEIKPAGN